MRKVKLAFIICFIFVMIVSTAYGVTSVTLDYLYRYNCQQGSGVDHLLTALAISDTRAIVAGYPALALIDLTALPVGGTTNYLDRKEGFSGEGFNARNLYFYHSVSLNKDYVFVNENCMGTQTNPWGFAVVRLDPGDKLIPICRRSVSGVFFEKMCIAQDRLYIAAHNEGVYIYNIANPEDPVQVGNFTDSRIVDAFDIVISNNKAYVADGAGGLKILNLVDADHLSYNAGESTATSVGTAEAITVKNGKVYMTLGTGYVDNAGTPTYYGLAVYNEGSITPRQLVPVTNNGFAEDLCWLTNDNYLAVSSYPAISIFDTSTSPPTLVAGDICARRGSGALLRLGTGVGSASNNRLLVASWNYMDVYQLKQASGSTQPDINSTEQRIRFGLTAETRPVILTNNGRGTLNITNITSTSGAFTTNYPGGTIPLSPGANYTFNISYNGSGNASGKIYVYSNDPDENPLPIQVYGNLSGYLDPGETAIDFTVDLVTRNPDTGQFTVNTDGFRLSNYLGKVVWIGIYGSWCPACMPTVADMQNGILKAFADNPNVVAKCYEVGGSQGETLTWLQTVWSNFYLRSDTLWEEDGYYNNYYKQPDTGLPFGRSYVIDQNGKIAGAYFGYDPTKAITKINDLLANPPTP